MVEKVPTNQTLPDSDLPEQVQPLRGPDTIEKQLEQQLESFIVQKIKELLQRAGQNPDKKRFMIDQIAASRATWFRGNDILLDTILQRIEAIPYSTDDQFEAAITRELNDVIHAHVERVKLTPGEMKRNFRLIKIEQDGNVALDKDGVTYCSQYDDVVEIHIAEGLTPDKWKEAASNLVTILRKDNTIKIIKMKSWVVADKLPYFRRLGFNANVITDKDELAQIRAHFDEGMGDNRHKPIGEAYMTREEFLKSGIVKRITGNGKPKPEEPLGADRNPGDPE
jgi:hypothetical protein